MTNELAMVFGKPEAIFVELYWQQMPGGSRRETAATHSSGKE
jgi:hypothetical protein